MSPNTITFSLLFVASMVLFTWSCYKRFGLITIGKSEDRFSHFFKRIWAMLLYAFGQKRVVSRVFGLNHFVIFWSFIILLIANSEFLLHGIFPSISLSNLPEDVYYPVSFILEIISLVTLISIFIASGRRIFFPPAYLSTPYVKARSFQAFLILTFIALLMIAFFGIHAAEISSGREAAGNYRPISSFVAGSLAGVSSSGLEFLMGFFWWLHALRAFNFYQYPPAQQTYAHHDFHS